MNISARCRTCLELVTGSDNITKKCHFNNSVKDVIIMIVPQMATTLSDQDCICVNCFNVLKTCMRFIEKCLEVEEKIKEEEFYQTNEVKDGQVLLLIEKSTIEVNNDHPPSDLKDEVIQEDSTLKEQNYSADNRITETSLDLNMSHSLPNSINGHDRVITLEQPSGVIMQKFLTDLSQSGINILQASDNPTLNASTTKKRILLLGTHIYNMAYKCPKCLKCLQSKKKYDGHIASCSKTPVKKEKYKEPLLKCPFCDRSIKSSRMELHIEGHERRQHKIALAKELKKKSKQRDLECKTCLERFTSEEDFQIHQEIHPPYVCNQCGKGFILSSSLHSHKNIHNDPNSFICEICGKGYKDKNMLNVHLQTHENKAVKCDKCPKVFNTRSRLRRHMKSVHCAGFTDQCTQCGKVFKNKTSHDSHVRLVHLKIKPYKCEICEAKFGRADYLQHHVMRHTGELKNSSQLLRRGRYRLNIKHNGEPLPCKFCGKRFLNVPRLKLHLETHVKICRFPCQFCPLTFARKQICKKHELSHKGLENFFRCNICWKRLISKEELDEHIASKHSNPRYACNRCGEMFHRAYLLNHHNLLEHRTPEDTEKAKQLVYDSLLEVSMKSES